jgi:hypothetical protein
MVTGLIKFYTPQEEGDAEDIACSCWEMHWEEFQTGLRDLLYIMGYYISISSDHIPSMML